MYVEIVVIYFGLLVVYVLRYVGSQKAMKKWIFFFIFFHMFFGVEKFFIFKNGNLQAFFTGSGFFVLCLLFSFNLSCVLSELQKCEEFSLVCCQTVLQLSYIDIDVIYLFIYFNNMKMLQIFDTYIISTKRFFCVCTW